ncbi:TIGR03943 family putative permease subunit [Marinitenerispora sediminis]|uniref:TIGR03943 family protein n=1 Tax=Marinitenerispora sediminis TaxID=1931232 RepID=A0A368SYS7_9ACTN|nr:TIGR03943 family protein [Marinitenerispora sediminis]RCV47723.1 TIGR03943 family protein [Marinitenerispora sediminis]RCV48270.1 TIGR03943 family protein [Marinitenerispora sediminis]RCV49915.1 TIGR03943 family protein [Marinitenerispora sediminis]
MNRIAQGIVLVLLGAAALSCTLASDLYLNYVQAAFRPFLAAAGVLLVALGVIAIAVDLRAAGPAAADAAEEPDHSGHGADSHGHGHRAPGVAWLLLLPVVAVFVVSPPALGAYTAAGAATAPPRDSAAALDDLDEDWGDPSEPREMELQEFVMRAWTDQERTLAGRTVRLTGFVVPNPEGEGWYLARLQMACCAADAIVNRVLITDQPEPPKDSWWQVDGTWVEPEGDIQDIRDHRFSVAEMAEVENPPDPYE